MANHIGWPKVGKDGLQYMDTTDSPSREDVLRSLLRRMDQSLRQLQADLAEIALMAGLRRGDAERAGSRVDFSTLSARELEIVRHLLAGRRVPHIARSLGLSPNTVRSHLKSVFKKLGVRSQGELIELCRGPDPV
ncbi:MAG: hypothetical protein D6689_14595 [Deltaproteobacteria bacterium]|nr:MAG: hypothetical protein D6689_14595 [Deltaproteobacteria bacterium]